MNNREAFTQIFEKLSYAAGNHGSLVNFFKDNMRSAGAYIARPGQEARYGEEHFSHPGFSVFSIDNEHGKRMNLKIVKRKNDGLEEVVDNDTTIELTMRADKYIDNMENPKEDHFRMGNLYYTKGGESYHIEFNVHTGSEQWALHSTRYQTQIGTTDRKQMEIEHAYFEGPAPEMER